MSLNNNYIIKTFSKYTILKYFKIIFIMLKNIKY